MVTDLPAGSTPILTGEPKNSSVWIEPVTAPSASPAAGRRRSPSCSQPYIRSATIGRVVAVAEPERVAHLVHQRGQQVVVAGRRAGRIGGHPRRGELVAELGIVQRRAVEEPAPAGGVGVDA